MRGKSSETGFLGHFVKGAVPIVAMQEQRLTIPRTGFQGVDLGIYMAVGYKKVEPGVVLHIKKTRTPADIRIAGMAYAGSPADIIEPLCAHVSIQRIGLLFKVRNKKAQAPAVVVVSEIHSHVPKFHAFTAQ